MLFVFHFMPDTCIFLFAFVAFGSFCWEGMCCVYSGLCAMISYVQLISFRLMTNRTFMDHMNAVKHRKKNEMRYKQWNITKKRIQCTAKRKKNSMENQTFFFTLSNMLCFLLYLFSWFAVQQRCLNYVWASSFFSSSAL